MCQNIHNVLQSYWGYDSFRPLQEDIIHSVLAGKDTLGLMPTGGGKSLTFQVPTMARKGMCLVITPLIALMKDQVENLKSKGIKAAAIYSGMNSKDILITLENGVFDAYKFLYLSPERLTSEIFLTKVQQMDINLIVVDEAHCISQWGYDFRPSYLHISAIRPLFPDIPILALTATATPDVVDDIQVQLDFKKKNLFQTTFYRNNIAYVVRQTEKKHTTLLNILNAVPGTSIVYVRNRKKTKEIADFLVENGIVAEHYHAGLSPTIKDIRQDRWKNNQTRVIVCTNAFGMGIDKPEVRTVIHIDLPDCIEAYFQEAGRAGRDGKKSYATLLYNGTDEEKMKKRIADNYPPKDKIREIYDALANYCAVAIDDGEGRSYRFVVGDFCQKFKQSINITHSAIKILQRAGYLELSEQENGRSLLQFIIEKDQLYQYKTNVLQEKVINTLLRSYTGLFADLTPIYEDVVAHRAGLTHQELYDTILQLTNIGMLRYVPRSSDPMLKFIHKRIPSTRLRLDANTYDDLKEKYVEKIHRMLQYATTQNICRSQLLLAYFGEKTTQQCGTCDICLSNRKRDMRTEKIEDIEQQIIQLLQQEKEGQSLKQIAEKTKIPSPQLIPVLRLLLDNGSILQNEQTKYNITPTK